MLRRLERPAYTRLLDGLFLLLLLLILLLLLLLTTRVIRHYWISRRKNNCCAKGCLININMEPKFLCVNFYQATNARIFGLI